jgi:hypothetical protein
VAEIKGKDNINNKDKLSNALIALLINIKEEEEQEEKPLNTYFTLIKSLLTKLLLVIPYIIVFNIKAFADNLSN